MSRPTCYICKKELPLTKSYYCLCDAKICTKCIESVQIDKGTWKCPKCGEINKISETKLFREKTE